MTFLVIYGLCALVHFLGWMGQWEGTGIHQKKRPARLALLAPVWPAVLIYFFIREMVRVVKDAL